MNDLLKKSENWKRRGGAIQPSIAEYEAIQNYRLLHYPIDRFFIISNVTRSAYYRWVKYPKSNNELRNERLSTEIQRIYNQHPDMDTEGFVDTDGHKGIHVNDKRVLYL